MAFIGNQPKWKTGGFIPQSSIPTSPREGDVYYDDGTNKAEGLYVYKNSVWEAVGAGSGSGINYIANGDASQGTTGWATYADAAAARPVDGTGGAANVTFTLNASSPLRGAADFILTKDAADRQGQGASYDFTIANADITTPCQIKINYKASAGFSFANNDIQVFIYDVTNAALIPVVPQTLDGSGHFKGEFQTSTSLSYRLILHVATTSAVAYTLQVDDVSVSPSSISYGFLPDKQYDIASQVSATTALTSVKAVAVPYKTRDGSWRMTFNISAYQASTLSNTITIAGVSFATTLTGDGHTVNTAASNATGVVARALTGEGNGTISWSITTAYTKLYLSGDLPLASMPTWAVDSAPVQIGDGADSRVVAAKVKMASQSLTANTALTFSSVTYDTHGAIVSLNSFVAPVAGIYKVSGTVQSISAANRFKLYKNGVLESYLSEGATAIFQSISNEVKVNAGDILTVIPNVTAGTTDSDSNLTFSRISGPASVAAAEKVFALYQSTNGIAFQSTDLIYNTKVKDSHAAYNTSTGVFTVPRSGVLKINGHIGTATVLLPTSQQLEVLLRIGGVNVTRIGTYFGNGASIGHRFSFTGLYYVTAGQLITVRANNDVAATLNTDPTDNWITFSME